MGLFVIGLMAAFGCVSYALWAKPKRPHKALSASSNERTATTLQVGDIVQHLGTDYLVDAVLVLHEDGQNARLYRLTDGTTERHLYARPNEPAPLLLCRSDPFLHPERGSIAQPAPEAFEHAGQGYRLGQRIFARASHAPASSERVRILEYVAARARLLVFQWSDRAEVFIGEAISPHVLEFLPAR